MRLAFSSWFLFLLHLVREYSLHDTDSLIFIEIRFVALRLLFSEIYFSLLKLNWVNTSRFIMIFPWPFEDFPLSSALHCGYWLSLLIQLLLCSGSLFLLRLPFSLFLVFCSFITKYLGTICSCSAWKLLWAIVSSNIFCSPFCFPPQTPSLFFVS